MNEHILGLIIGLIVALLVIIVHVERTPMNKKINVPVFILVLTLPLIMIAIVV